MSHLPFIPKEESSVPIERVAVYGLRAIYYFNTCNDTGLLIHQGMQQFTLLG